MIMYIVYTNPLKDQDLEIELKENFLRLAGIIKPNDYIQLQKVLQYFDRSQTLEIFIQTKGGALKEALEMAHFMEEFETIIHPYKNVDSSGLLLLMVGKKRPANFFGTNPTFLFHLPYDIQTGNVLEDSYVKDYVTVMSPYLKIGKNEILQLLKNQKSISVNKAKKIGLVN